MLEETLRGNRIQISVAGDKTADKSFIPDYWRDKYLSSVAR